MAKRIRCPACDSGMALTVGRRPHGNAFCLCGWNGLYDECLEDSSKPTVRYVTTDARRAAQIYEQLKRMVMELGHEFKITVDSGESVDLRQELSRARDVINKYHTALAYYASGNIDLEPRADVAHLYAPHVTDDSPEWRQRSMSDYTSGRIAREALEYGDTLPVVIDED